MAIYGIKRCKVHEGLTSRASQSLVREPTPKEQACIRLIERAPSFLPRQPGRDSLTAAASQVFVVRIDRWLGVTETGICVHHHKAS